MANPIDLLENSPVESSQEEEVLSDSMEDETSAESEITNGGSETVEPNGTEEEFWVKYPYIKNRLVTSVAEGSVPENFLEDVKLLGDESAKKLNDMFKTLFNKEIKLSKERSDVVVSVAEILKL